MPVQELNVLAEEVDADDVSLGSCSDEEEEGEEEEEGGRAYCGSGQQTAEAANAGPADKEAGGSSNGTSALGPRAQANQEMGRCL